MLHKVSNSDILNKKLNLKSYSIFDFNNSDILRSHSSLLAYVSEQNIDITNYRSNQNISKTSTANEKYLRKQNTTPHLNIKCKRISKLAYFKQSKSEHLEAWLNQKTHLNFTQLPHCQSVGAGDANFNKTEINENSIIKRLDWETHSSRNFIISEVDLTIFSEEVYKNSNSSISLYNILDEEPSKSLQTKDSNKTNYNCQSIENNCIDFNERHNLEYTTKTKIYNQIEFAFYAIIERYNLNSYCSVYFLCNYNIKEVGEELKVTSIESYFTIDTKITENDAIINKNEVTDYIRVRKEKKFLYSADSFKITYNLLWCLYRLGEKLK